MKRAEIEAGKTYANAKGTIHREVIDFVPTHTIYGRTLYSDSLAVLFTVTKGQSNRYHGETGACTLVAFAQWAKSEVTVEGTAIGQL